MKRLISHIFLLTLISVQLATTASAQYGSVPRRYTSRLPAVEKVELQKLKPSDYGFKGVEQTKIVEGAEAKKFASMWRAQSFHGMPATCHEPAFGVKFFFKNKTTMHASICWQCNNIVVLEPKLKSNSTQGFARDSQRGEELLELFKRTFP